jgi:hypothetical protein
MENDDFEDLTPSPSQESFTTATEGSDILKATIEKQEEILKVLETNVATPPDLEMEEVGLKEDPRLKPSLMGAKEEFGEDVGKDALEDQYEIDPEYDDEGEEGEGPALVPKVPLQLRMQLRLVNKDQEGQDPMSFQVTTPCHVMSPYPTSHVMSCHVMLLTLSFASTCHLCPSGCSAGSYCHEGHDGAWRLHSDQRPRGVAHD